MEKSHTDLKNYCKKKTFLVTGGAGFIGSHMCEMLSSKGHDVVILDALTYAGQLNNLNHIKSCPNVHFVRGNINDGELVLSLLQKYKVDTLINFAAETHVDNSIASPTQFIETNINGTHRLLEASMRFIKNHSDKPFKFVQISTDEVFGEISSPGELFSENTAYAPRSPYSASKAAADHLVRAWHSTFNFPIIITHCSNNYGFRQHNEKLIPTIIRNALIGNEIPIYGDGQNIRDWLHVEDHCSGIYLAIENGILGESYCFGGGEQLKNIELAKKICRITDRLFPKKNNTSYIDQIKFITDRKGHDRHYAIDYTKAREKLGYSPVFRIDNKIEETIQHYSSFLRN